MKKKPANILVGVCGGIASYKTCELVRLFIKGGYSVKVMMTETAGKFVTPLVFGELSQNPVYTDMFAPVGDEKIKHVSLAQWTEVCVIAPLSANTLSKIAVGICDNLVTTVVCALAEKTPVFLVPAMNENMWKNPIIQGNVKKLRGFKKYVLMNPKTGALACGVYGEGRMQEPQDIYKTIQSVTRLPKR